MDQFLIVGTLQGLSYLLDIGDDGGECKRGAFGMEITQGSIEGIVHHQEGNSALHTELEDTHDMGMDKASNGTSFGAECIHIVAAQLRVEHFDSCLCAQVNVFPR